MKIRPRAPKLQKPEDRGKAAVILIVLLFVGMAVHQYITTDLLGRVPETDTYPTPTAAEVRRREEERTPTTVSPTPVPPAPPQHQQPQRPAQETPIRREFRYTVPKGKGHLYVGNPENLASHLQTLCDEKFLPVRMCNCSQQLKAIDGKNAYLLPGYLLLDEIARKSRNMGKTTYPGNYKIVFYPQGSDAEIVVYYFNPRTGKEEEFVRLTYDEIINRMEEYLSKYGKQCRQGSWVRKPYAWRKSDKMLRTYKRFNPSHAGFGSTKGVSPYRKWKPSRA